MAQGKLVLMFLSNIRDHLEEHSIIKEAKTIELDLRKGQANDALEKLRENLEYKSMLMHEKVRMIVLDSQ